MSYQYQLLPQLPDLLALHAHDPKRFPVLLESTGRQGWDILLMEPEFSHAVSASKLSAADYDPFLWIEEQWRREAASAEQAEQFPAVNTGGAPPQLPFRGGWFLFFGYEALHWLEAKVPRPTLCNLGLPVAYFMRVRQAIQIDRARGCAWWMAESGFQGALNKLNNTLNQLPTRLTPLLSPFSQVRALQEEDPENYLSAIARVKRYICDGDVFQVNLSRRWKATVEKEFDAAQLYTQLRRVNAAPFSGLARLNEQAIISASPERLLRVRFQNNERLAETRPIAGTRPRATDLTADAAIQQQLLESRKERAEHIMLVDLARNDLGRVCRPGTIGVEPLMELQSYAFVHHLESNVAGNLRGSVSPIDALRALFPGGTITGCPKVRTMQIIQELETEPRGAYTGGMGYLNRDGSLDFNILIRSFEHSGDTLTFRAGGGIVADSDPMHELLETRAKAKGLLRALGITE